MKEGGSLSLSRFYQSREIPRIPRVETEEIVYTLRTNPPPTPLAEFSLRVDHQYPD